MKLHVAPNNGLLQYDRKFQIFIFLIGYINVNKGVFCLIISYLRIKSYNVLNYNNCSTDWSFPLRVNLLKNNLNSVCIFCVDVFQHLGGRVMIVNNTFTDISVISWWSVLLVGETGVLRENYRPVESHWQTLSHNVVSSTKGGDRHWLHR